MEVIYRTPAYVIGWALLAASLLAYGGFRDRRRRGFNSAVGLAWLLALMIAVIQLPMYLLDEIRIYRERMEWSVGPWWARSGGSIVFAEVRSVRVEPGASKSGRLRYPQTAWVLQGPDGSTTRYVLPGLWMEHYQEIRKHFVAKGIVVPEVR